MTPDVNPFCRLTASAMVALLAAGCFVPADSSDTGGGEVDVSAAASAAESQASEESGDDGAVLAVIADGDQYRQKLEELQGSIVLVDFWATWCPPCVKDFPKTVAIEQKLGRRGVKVVTVSFDDPDDIGSVNKFLTEQHAGDLTNFVSKFGAGNESFDAFETDGQVPMYRIYDRDGTLAAQFKDDGTEESDFSHSDIELKILQLLVEG